MPCIDVRKLLALILVLCLNGLIVAVFHDRGWYPQDAGVFAHAAERSLSSDPLVFQMDDVHPGYLNFINGWALAVFGRDFASMNHPLMAALFIQALFIFFVFWKRGMWQAVTASLVPSALGVLQFINPNHHWYALFLSLGLAALLSRRPQEGDGRRFVSGILVASVFLFRQLTGVFLGMGCLALFLYEVGATHQPGRERARWAGGLLWVMLLGLVFYMLRVTNLTGFILFGLPPLTLLWWLRLNVHVPDRVVGRILYQFVAGIIFGCIPVLGYHILHGDVGGWLNNTFLASLTVLKQTFLTSEDYFKIVFCGAYEIFNPETPAVFLNGIFWTVLPLTGLANLIMLIRRLQAIPSVPAHMLAFPILGCFYGLVALHYQIAVYLFFTISVPMLGVLWMAGANPGFKRGLTTACLLLLMAIGIYFHAGQPNTRAYLRGDRAVMAYAGERIPRLHVWVDQGDLTLYEDLLAAIRSNSREGDPILVVPNDAELYFLSGRRNPFRFLSTDQGIQNPVALESVLASLRQAPPVMVIDRPQDKRHTPYSQDLMAYVKGHYELMRRIGPFDVYVPRRPDGDAQL